MSTLIFLEIFLQILLEIFLELLLLITSFLHTHISTKLTVSEKQKEIKVDLVLRDVNVYKISCLSLAS